MATEALTEIELLKNRVAELEEAFGLTLDLPYAILGERILLHHRRGPKVQEVVKILLARPIANRVAIYTILYGALPELDQPEIKIIDILMCSARLGLKQHGIEVETVWGCGWRLTESNKRKLRETIERLLQIAA